MAELVSMFIGECGCRSANLGLHVKTGKSDVENTLNSIPVMAMRTAGGLNVTGVCDFQCDLTIYDRRKNIVWEFYIKYAATLLGNKAE